jgi:hypothetical protein
LHPQSVAVALRQVDPRTRTASLLDNPDFQLARGQSPASILSLVYLDTRSLTRLTYPARLMLETAAASQMAASGRGLDLDRLPPFRDALEDVHNFVATGSRMDDGLMWTFAGSGEVPKLLMSVRSLVLAAALPQVNNDLKIDAASARANHLRALAISCTLYAVDHDGRFPGTLEEMVDAGLIQADDLHPAWASDTASAYVYVPGQKQGEHPRNVLIHERRRGNEPILVAFTDGSVRRVKPDRFEKVWKETRVRLGLDSATP